MPDTEGVKPAIAPSASSSAGGDDELTLADMAMALDGEGIDEAAAAIDRASLKYEHVDW